MRAFPGLAAVALVSVAAVSACTLADSPTPATFAPAGAASAGICGAGRFALEGFLPDTPTSDAAAEASPAGTWAITDNSAQCGCTLTLSEGAFGRRSVKPESCRHPGIAAAREYALGATTTGTELALLASDGDQVLLRLTRITNDYYAGMLNGRPVVFWRPSADDQER